jgi:SAM-dependent methyltransferase
VPVARFDEFVPKMAEILQRFHVNSLNVSVRHAYKDPGSLLAWAKEEVFAFVLYYKQRVSEAACREVAVWTRELVDAALSCNGSYYLPYQPHATIEQFNKAYPGSEKFFKLKAKLDPDYKFRNKLWDKYYMPQPLPVRENHLQSDFHEIYDDIVWQDKFFLFLQNVYRICPESKFHNLIIDACSKYQTDKEIYNYIQKELPSIKSALSDIRYGIPALIKQKKVMAEQTVELLENNKTINGYVEIGSTGRYISKLRKYFSISEPVYLINDIAPTNSPVDIAERGQIKPIGRFINLDNYKAIETSDIPDASMDVVTCYIGLHHAPLDRLDGFVRSINRILRPGGSFIVRDHDVDSSKMRAFVALAHTVFNAGLGVPWENNYNELRYFTSAKQLINYLGERGFKFTGKKLLQDHDPSINMLMQFVKEV